MNRGRFTVQVLVILALVTLVSWPEQRRVRASGSWRNYVEALRAGRTASADRLSGSGWTGVRSATASGDRRSANEYGNGSRAGSEKFDWLTLGREGSAAAGTSSVQMRSNAIIGVIRVLGTDKIVPNGRLVLRHIRTGVIASRAVANGAGQFSFFGVDPSEYYVEFVDDQGAVIATSGALSIGYGEMRETTVQVTAVDVLRQPFESTGTTGTAREVVEAAADRGVTQVTSPEQSISPRH